jgi:hypothetical protein
MDIHTIKTENTLSDGLELYDLHQQQSEQKSEGLFNYIKHIKPSEIIIYLGIIILTVMFIISVSPTYLHIVGILFGIGIVYFIINMKDTTGTDYNNIEEMKLLSPQLRDTHFMYLDTDFIDLFYDLGEYQFYSNTKFKEVIKHVDNFLHLETDLGKNPFNKQDIYEVLDELKSKILNNFHAMIYDLPQQKLVIDKYNNATKKIHLLLNQHLNEARKMIRKLSNGKLPLDMYPIDHPIPNDKMTNYHFDVY